MQTSASRKGICWDNAPMESFFGTLKTECLHHYRFKTRESAKRVIFEYIEVFYNRLGNMQRSVTRHLPISPIYFTFIVKLLLKPMTCPSTKLDLAHRY